MVLSGALVVHDLFSYFGCVWWVGGQVCGVLLEQQQQQTILFAVRLGERFRYRYEHPGWFNGHPEK
jgi:hypothetical protein